MNYITLETTCNLFGKPKRFIDIVATQPVIAEKLFKGMPDRIIDKDTVKKIYWMFPESTNEAVDRIILRNNERILRRNQKIDELVGHRRCYTSSNGRDITYRDSTFAVVRAERIRRPIDKLNELFN